MAAKKLPTNAYVLREGEQWFGSGLVGGGGLTGVLLALWVAVRGGERIVGFPLDMPEAATQALAAVTILAILGIMVKIATRPAVA